MIKISIIMFISKILKDLYLIRQCKNKKHFCRYCLQCLSSERFLMEYKKTCLEINSKQSVTLESCTIKFKSYFK